MRRAPRPQCIQAASDLEGPRVTVAELLEEGQSSQQAAKVRVSPNRRAIKLQKAFEKLKPVEQQVVLKQVRRAAGQE